MDQEDEKIEIPDQLTLNLFNEAETESTVLKNRTRNCR